MALLCWRWRLLLFALDLDLNSECSAVLESYFKWSMVVRSVDHGACNLSFCVLVEHALNIRKFDQQRFSKTNRRGNGQAATHVVSKEAMGSQGVGDPSGGTSKGSLGNASQSSPKNS